MINTKLGNLVNLCALFLTMWINKHLMTGHKGNSELCFPETLNVPRGEASWNIERLGETKLTVSRGASH